MTKSRVVFTLVVFYIAAFVLAYLNPMQSDDFSFYLMGTSLSEHWHFYMTWSGRVVVDYLSTLVLAMNHPLLIALFSSLALPLLIYTVASMPYFQGDMLNKKRFVGTLFILWGGYWLANPALGQTTFWVVGAANYLWPLVFVALLLKYLLRILHGQKPSGLGFCGLLLLAVLAGCSNEATGALVLYCLVLLYGWAWLNKLVNRSTLVLCFVVVLVSYLVLLLAPGNMVRAGHPEYAAWRSMALDARLSQHFGQVLPSILKSYGVVYLLLAWAFGQCFRSLGRSSCQVVMIWLSAAIVFCVILIASPHAMIARSHLTGLFFLLVALSFLLKEALQFRISGLGKLLLGALGVLFVVSYGLMLMAYWSIHQQSQVRIAIVEQAKAEGKQEVVIPGYYKERVLRTGDLPELDYHNPDAMGRYYGLKAIALTFPDFNYARLLAKPCEFDYSAINKRVQCVYVQRILGSDTLRFVVKFDPSIQSLGNLVGYFKLAVKNAYPASDSRHYQLVLPLRVIQIGSDSYASVDALASLLEVKQNPQLSVGIVEGDVDLSNDDKLPWVSIQVE